MMRPSERRPALPACLTTSNPSLLFAAPAPGDPSGPNLNTAEDRRACVLAASPLRHAQMLYCQWYANGGDAEESVVLCSFLVARIEREQS